MHAYAHSLRVLLLSLCTSLQLLSNLGLADKYEGQTDVNGEDYNVEAMGDGPHPFRAFLDVGLTRTTTGNRVFAAMKGAVDGGIDVPHRLVCVCVTEVLPIYTSN